MFKHIKGLILSGLLVTSLVVAGCTSGTAGSANPPANTTNDGEKTEVATPAQVRDDLIIGMEADALTLLPNTVGDSVTWAYTHNLVYEPLVTRDGEGKYIPVLATEWSSVDELTWEFKLRSDVKFQNGDVFNAEAVKYSIDYIFDEANKSIFTARIPLVERAEVVDDHTVRIITSKPFPELIDNLVNIMILDPAYIKEVGVEKAAEQPNGTGVYKLNEWQKGQSVKLSVNESYWGAQPEIKQVTFKTIPEFSARLSAFLAGEIDLFNNVPVDSIEKVKNSPNVKVVTKETARYIYLLLNTFYDGPLKDTKVRQALNYAINQDEIIASVLNGYGAKLPGVLAPANLAYSETPDYAYDPDKAVALLKEAGYEPEELNLQLDTPNGRYPMDSYVAQAIAAQLQKIGVKVNVVTNEWGSFLADVKGKKKKDMYIMGWGPNFEPQGVILGLFTKDATYSGYYDKESEAIIQNALSIFDPEKRKQAYAEVQKDLVEKAASVPLWLQTDVYAVAEDLNFNPRIDQTFVPQEITWSK